MKPENISVVGLVCSRRKKGNSHVLVGQALKGAESAGARAEIIEAASLNIATCRGCLSCVFRGKCPQEDDFQLLLEKIVSCEGLVAAAPTYMLSPAAPLKCLLDRSLMLSSYRDEKRPGRRAAVTFSVAGNSSWNPLGVMVNQLALCWGFEVVDYREAYAPGPAEAVLQEDLMDSAFTMGQKLVGCLKGKGSRRKPGPGECPACYSTVFQLHDNGAARCPFCLTEGTFSTGAEGGKIDFVEEEKNGGHFWAAEKQEHHLENWIKATRKPFLSRRKEIKRRLAEMGFMDQ